MKNVGTTSPPLKPLPMVTAVNSGFPEKRVGRRLSALDGAGDDVHAGAVVVPRADEQRQHDHDPAARGDAQPRVRDAAGKQPLRAVHGHAKRMLISEHTAASAAAQQQKLRRGRECKRELRRRDAEGVGDGERSKRGDDARHERGIVKHAHADDLTRKWSRSAACRQARTRRSCRRAWRCAYPFHRGETAARCRGKAAADLQCRALTTGAAANDA